MTYIYPILIILQSYSGEGGVTSYNSIKGGIDLKRFRIYDLYNSNVWQSLFRKNENILNLLNKKL